MACVFKDMFRMRKLNDKSDMDAISNGVLDAIPIPRIATDKSRNPPVSGIRLSYRDTSQPENGKPISELTGINNRMVPNSASLYPKFVLIVGILEAQDAKQKPDKKKNKLRKNRCLFLTSMRLQLACEYHISKPILAADTPKYFATTVLVLAHHSRQLCIHSPRASKKLNANDISHPHSTDRRY